ncbi:1-acyl-sn-glycerol-3-phosphate acyltransferase [Cyclobacteriaceae bacterium]|nr:1-acyl-sn-glycerol-3-phosphate acyltransferase [Cyclobacteriaceae bacterium]
MKVFGAIYGVWCGVMVAFFYLLTYPFSWLFIQFKFTYPAAHFMNRVWGVLVHFFNCLIIVRNNYYKPKGPVIYVSNHTSYLDISTMFLILPGYFSIIGKSALGKVPLFGPMFRKLYITVDRRSKESRLKSYTDSLEAIDQGRSLFIFPEGTIPDKGAPKMSKFKDGAFKIAIEKQIPIVPISFPYNWIILPDSNFLGAKWHWISMNFHPQIETKGLTDANASKLKDDVYDIIQKDINKHNKL